MTEYTSQAHIRELCESGALEIADALLCDEIATGIEELPWNEAGTRLDWERLSPFIVVRLTDERWFSVLAEESLLTELPVAIALFSHSEGVFGDSQFVLANLDEISGNHLVCVSSSAQREAETTLTTTFAC